MKKLMQRSTSRKQLLLNTITHFNSNNRAQTELGGCRYRLENRACAIGREISDELANSIVGSVRKNDTFESLPKRLQRLGKTFLRNIQILHDFSSNWNENGLNDSGKIEVRKICERYKIKSKEIEKLIKL